MLTTRLNKLGPFSRDRKLLFQAVLFLPIIHIALFFLEYYRLHRFTEKLVPLKHMNISRPETEILHQAREIAQLCLLLHSMVSSEHLVCADRYWYGGFCENRVSRAISALVYG